MKICVKGLGGWQGLVFLLALCGFAYSSSGVPSKLGDINEDNSVNVLDLVRLLSHIDGTTNLPAATVPFADINGDAFLNDADVEDLATLILGLSIPPKPVVLDPITGASQVGVSVRPKAVFPRPINVSTLNSNNFYASFAGRKLPASIVPAANGTFAWLFFDPPMPSASQITITVEGSTITNLFGQSLDADGNGVPGGGVQASFSTVSIAPVPGTVVTSRIVDPGPDLIPRTADDISLGGNGFNYLRPISRVKVYVLGMESNFTYTGTNGIFTLTNMPVGDVKVVIDGRTATNPPAGYYFPEMVMDTTFLPGITNGVMNIVDTNGVVMRDANGIPIRANAMYLPRIASNILQTVSSINTTTITLNSNAAYNLPTNQQQFLTIQIQPGSLIGPNGQPLSNGQVGISVVPPELVRDMLPPGLLQHTFDITVQAPGTATFSTPAAMTFPNVFNAAPGTKLNFLSFDHTTGRLVIDGTATVSADGLYVTTDPGSGVTHPGWHGLSPPGAQLLTIIKGIMSPAAESTLSICEIPLNYAQTIPLDELNDLANRSRDIVKAQINSALVKLNIDASTLTAYFTNVGSQLTLQSFMLYVQQRQGDVANIASSGLNALFDWYDNDFKPGRDLQLKQWESGADSIADDRTRLAAKAGILAIKADIILTDVVIDGFLKNTMTPYVVQGNKFIGTLASVTATKLEGKSPTSILETWVQNTPEGKAWAANAIWKGGLATLEGLTSLKNLPSKSIAAIVANGDLLANDLVEALQKPSDSENWVAVGNDLVNVVKAFNRKNPQIETVSKFLGKGNNIATFGLDELNAIKTYTGLFELLNDGWEKAKQYDELNPNSPTSVPSGVPQILKRQLNQLTVSESRFPSSISDVISTQDSIVDLLGRMHRLTQLIVSQQTAPTQTQVSELNNFGSAIKTLVTDYSLNAAKYDSERVSFSQAMGSLANAYNAGRQQSFLADSTFISLEQLDGTIIFRGKPQSQGILISPSTIVVVKVFSGSPIAGVSTVIEVGASGQINTLNLPLIGFSQSGQDSDLDGLLDDAEAAIGTDPNKWSTAGDGVSDGAKVAQGLDPLSGRGFSTGVIASLPLVGEAKEVTLLGSTVAATDQTAYVACGTRGLSIVNASQFQSPIVLGQLDLAGNATDVAIDPNLNLALVAANAGGLHLVDVSDSTQPKLSRTININASQVETIGGVAYVAVGSQLWSYDIATRTLLQTLPIDVANITGLTTEGFFLYTMDANRVLRVVDISDGGMVARGSLTMPAGGGRIFVGNGIAYITAGNGATAGFATANVSNPESPTLIKGVDALNIEGDAIAVNGSGLATTVGSIAGAGGVQVPALDVVDVSNPANTGGFVTRFPLSAKPFSVSISAGIAFVAGGTAGLQVVNYRNFDNQGAPPTIALTNSFPMTGPTNGISEEGKLARVVAITTDDVQVRNVEFFVDGVETANDVSFPFEHRFVTPMRIGNKTIFTIQAKATDTGGNVRFTPVQTIALVPDATPPKVVHTFPKNQDILGSINFISATFNEPMQVATLTTSNLTVLYAGLDGKFGNQDDQVMPNGVIAYFDDQSTATLTFPTNLPPGNFRGTVSASVRDLAGNAMGANHSWNFYVLGGADSDQDGIPDNVEALLGYDPNSPDSNGNGILDGDEDKDGDGLKNKWELLYGYNPLVNNSEATADPDGDTLNNLQEQANKTNPTIADTDGDGWNDETEVTAGSNPLDPLSRPKMWVVAKPAIQAVLLGMGSTNTQPLNVTVARPLVHVFLPTVGGDTNSLPLNVTVARPPVVAFLPGLGDTNSLPLNVTVARPAVQVFLPSLGDTNTLPLNVTVAKPPVTVFLLGMGDTNGVQLNTTIAQPPVRVEWSP